MDECIYIKHLVWIFTSSPGLSVDSSVLKLIGVVAHWCAHCGAWWRFGRVEAFRPKGLLGSTPALADT